MAFTLTNEVGFINIQCEMVEMEFIIDAGDDTIAAINAADTNSGGPTGASSVSCP